jgi:hypothetical protein
MIAVTEGVGLGEKSTKSVNNQSNIRWKKTWMYFELSQKSEQNL